MADSEKQAAFVSGLRKLAEEAAAKNPVLADMRSLGKALVSEMRAEVACGQECVPLGAYMERDGEVLIVRPNAADSDEVFAEVLLTLKARAKEGNIRAAALCNVRGRQAPGGQSVKYIQVHMEHAQGKALLSAVPADESVSRASLPGVDGPALNFFGGPTQPKIFAQG
jgi:hypothetical protein